MSVLLPKRLDRNIVYYDSGPMMGYPENNFPAFAYAAEELREASLLIVSPHEIGANLTPEVELPWQDYLREDIKVMMENCGGIILLDGWPQSKGARLELEVAMSLAWPVYLFHKGSGDTRGEFANTLIDMNKKI